MIKEAFFVTYYLSEHHKYTRTFYNLAQAEDHALIVTERRGAYDGQSSIHQEHRKGFDDEWKINSAFPVIRFVDGVRV